MPPHVINKMYVVLSLWLHATWEHSQVQHTMVSDGVVQHISGFPIGDQTGVDTWIQPCTMFGGTGHIITNGLVQAGTLHHNVIYQLLPSQLRRGTYHEPLVIYRR